MFGLIQAGQRLLEQTLPIAQAGMRKTDAAEVFRGLAVGLRLPELRSLNEDYYSAAAEEFGVSRERVRQIEVSAFAKVQNAVKHGVAAMATPAPPQVR